jgi:DNA-directed RNA polymerase I, II, and III subunit RPABC1
VIFSGPGIVKVNVIRNIAGQIVNRDTLTGLILIVQNQITSQALKAINLLNFKVEIFQVCFSLSLSHYSLKLFN